MMKSTFLLPRVFSIIGLGILLIMLFLFVNEKLQLFPFTLNNLSIRTFVLLDDTPFSETKFFTQTEVSLGLTIILAGVLLGLGFMSFSRRRVEDEMVQSLRLSSWSWSIVALLLLVLFLTLFVYGATYLWIMVFFPHLLLLLFTIIFNIKMFKMNKMSLNEE